MQTIHTPEPQEPVQTEAAPSLQHRAAGQLLHIVTREAILRLQHVLRAAQPIHLRGRTNLLQAAHTTQDHQVEVTIHQDQARQAAILQVVLLQAQGPPLPHPPHPPPRAVHPEEDVKG